MLVNASDVFLFTLELCIKITTLSLVDIYLFEIKVGEEFGLAPSDVS